MNVGVDEAGQDVEAGGVDDFCAGGRNKQRGRGDGADALTADEDGHVGLGHIVDTFNQRGALVHRDRIRLRLHN